MVYLIGETVEEIPTEVGILGIILLQAQVTESHNFVNGKAPASDLSLKELTSSLPRSVVRRLTECLAKLDSRAHFGDGEKDIEMRSNNDRKDRETKSFPQSWLIQTSSARSLSTMLGFRVGITVDIRRSTHLLSHPVNGL